MLKVLGSFFLASCLLAPSLSGHDDSEGVDVEVLQKSSISWDGDALPEYPEGTPEVTVLRITIPAHTKLPLHHHPVINAGVLTRGQLTVVTVDGKELHLEAGDSLVELVGTVHFGRNDSDEPAEIIVFYAGIQGEPITVKETRE